MHEPVTAIAWVAAADHGLRGALFALLALMGLNMLRLPTPRRPLERLGLALAAGLCVQVVAQSPAMEAGPPVGWRAPLVGVAMGNSALFWLFARTLCDDDFHPARRHLLAWAGVVAAGTINLAWLGPWCGSGRAPGWAAVVSQAVFGLPLLFGLLGIAAAAHHWRDDLVERRRWLRAFVVVGGSLYTLGMVLARRTTADGRLTPELAVVDALVLLVFVGATAWMLLQPQRGELVAAPPCQPAPDGATAGTRDGADAAAPAQPAQTDRPDPADERLAAALAQAMQVDRLYKDPALSVAGLAARLAVPEYRLRRLINRRLGHRNFSTFLNGHRLHEARAALADPAQRHLPVLTIALEAGFGSIGPFNRAFKQATGLTPTDYRRQHGTDS